MLTHYSQRALFVAFGLLLVLTGCGEERTVGESDFFSTQRIGDTTIVTNLRWDHPDTALMVEVARIGKFNGPEEYLLSSTSAFTVGWRGEVYVADDDGIRVFSPDGLEVRRIARSGEGPGEIDYVVGLEVDESGRLLVVDYGNRRVAVLDTSGAVLDHWRLPYGRPGYGRSAVVPSPGGQTLLSLNPPFDPHGGPQTFPRPILVRLDSLGRVLDTVMAPARLTDGCPTLDDPYFSTGFYQDHREPMFPKVKWTASRSGEVIYGCPASYQIDRVQPGGSVLRIIRERDPMLASREERQAFVEGWEWSRGVRVPGWSWKGPLPPEQKPYYHRIIPGRQGRLWVWPGFPRQLETSYGTQAWKDPKTGTFDVFDASGHFLGPVLLPDGAEFAPFPGREAPFFSGDTVWLIRRDSLDVEYVDRMVIKW